MGANFYNKCPTSCNIRVFKMNVTLHKHCNTILKLTVLLYTHWSLLQLF